MFCIGHTKKGIQCHNKKSVDNQYCKRHQKLYKLDKPDDCPICMESLEGINRPLNCGHWVHTDCLLKWNDICPTCRAPVNLTKSQRRKLNKNTNKTDIIPIQIEITFNDNGGSIDFNDWFNSFISIFESN